jgi:hypothetical protein
MRQHPEDRPDLAGHIGAMVPADARGRWLLAGVVSGTVAGGLLAMVFTALNLISVILLTELVTRWYWWLPLIVLFLVACGGFALIVGAVQALALQPARVGARTWRAATAWAWLGGLVGGLVVATAGVVGLPTLFASGLARNAAFIVNLTALGAAIGLIVGMGQARGARLAAAARRRWVWRSSLGSGLAWLVMVALDMLGLITLGAFSPTTPLLVPGLLVVGGLVSGTVYALVTATGLDALRPPADPVVTPGAAGTAAP